MEIFTERLKLKDVLPEKAKSIAKEYKLKVDDIEFVRKKSPLNPEDLTIEDGERAAVRYINTADLDRDNEIILPNGIDVKDFSKSPSVLYAHDYRSLPVGRDAWIKLVKGKGWLAKTIYATHQLAEDVYNLVKGKFLNTSSIGFIPLESVKPEDKDWGKYSTVVKDEYGIKEDKISLAKRIYTKVLLLEHSDVPIPSNINALNVAVGKGLEIKTPELIDDLGIEIIDEETINKPTEDENKTDEKEIITKPEETEDYIRIPVKGEEGKHEGHKIRTMDISESDGIKGLYCIDCKKIITYLFLKSKGWTMEKAKKWMSDHKKRVVEIPDEQGGIAELKVEDDEEKNKGFSLEEVYEIVKENKELKARLEEAELKFGAVLNKKNKANLKNAQNLIQVVLDSSEPMEEEKEIEIEEEELDIENEDKNEDDDNGKIEIDEKELAEIVKSALNEQVEKKMGKIQESLSKDIDNVFKKVKGKVM